MLSATNKVDAELKKIKAGLKNGPEVIKALVGPDATAESRGKILGDALTVMLTPAVRKVQLAGDRIEQHQRNLHLAFALGIYKGEHGRYPRRLDELAPKYLASIPQDLFSGKALVYLPGADSSGYLLYSFGMNGRDDQGRSYDDEPPGDDIRVRMPLPPVK